MRKILSIIMIAMLLFGFMPESVRAEENEDEALIRSFYSALNDKDYSARAEMTAGDYHDTLVEITGSELYIENRLGFYNVESVNEVEILGSITAEEYPDLIGYA